MLGLKRLQGFITTAQTCSGVKLEVMLSVNTVSNKSTTTSRNLVLLVKLVVTAIVNTTVLARTYCSQEDKGWIKEINIDREQILTEENRNPPRLKKNKIESNETKAEQPVDDTSNKDQNVNFHSYQDVKVANRGYEKKGMEEHGSPEVRGHFSKQQKRTLLHLMETPTHNALIAQDGIEGYDWSYQAEEEQPTNHALMTFTSFGSSSSSDFEVDSCSKTCVKAYASFKEQYDNLSSDYKKSQFNLVSYKAGLELVEARLAHYKKNETVFEESINVLKLEVRLRDNALNEYKMNLEKAEKDRDQLKQTLEKFQNSSKSLNNILESQVIDKSKTGLGYDAATAASPAVESFVNLTDKSGSDKGYHSVPPPLTGNFIPRKPDLTFMDEIVESENLDVTTVFTPCNVKTVEDKGVSNTVESNADRMNNTSAPIIED
ncbi:hypothetical protein Tco_0087465 [Tanacetum coccineum]